MVKLGDIDLDRHEIREVGRESFGTRGTVYVIRCSCGAKIEGPDEKFSIEYWGLHAHGNPLGPNPVRPNPDYLPYSKLYTTKVYNVQRDSRKWVERIPVSEIGPVDQAGRTFYWVVTVDADDGIRDLTEIPKVLKSTDTWTEAVPKPPPDPTGPLVELVNRFRDDLVDLWKARP